MNSEWYIFKGTHHIGPFTGSELVSKFQSGEISDSILVWREGEKTWVAFKNAKEFSHLFNKNESLDKKENLENVTSLNQAKFDNDTKNLPRPLTKDINKIGNAKENDIEHDFDDELPPPIPLELFNKDAPPSLSKTKPDFVLSDEFILENSNTLKSPAKSQFTNWLFAGIVSIVILFIGVNKYYVNTNDVHFKIRNLMPFYVEKLEGVATSISSDAKFGMALSMDGKTLFVATNNPNEINLSIKLSPIKGRILSNEEVTVYLKGTLKSNLGEFDKMILPEGKNFSPGEYNYVIHATEKHFINRLFTTLFGTVLIKDLNKNYTFDGNDIIYPSSPKDFETKLLKFKKEIFIQNSKPIVEKIEKLNTLIALIDQMQLLVNEKISLIKSKSDYQKIESIYQKDVAPILQNMTEESNGSEINNLIKESSMLFFKNLELLNVQKKIVEKDQKRIVQDMTTGSNAIKEKVKIVTKKLEDSLQLIK